MVRVRTRLTRATRREQIIDAAVDVFKGRDPNDVTFEEVADAAGVSRALVYNYFGDRRGLVAAVFQRHTDRLHAAVTAGFDGNESFREAVEKVVRQHFTYAREDPDGYRNATGEGPSRHPEVIEGRLNMLGAAFGGGPEARLVARSTLALVEAAALRWLDRADLSMERAIEVVTELMWGGIEATERIGLQQRRVWSPELDRSPGLS
jgi:AcrR family transcriptional regulator